MSQNSKNYNPIKIIVDTREQEPFTFSTHSAEIYRDKLDAGDYSIFAHDMPKDDHSIIVERKKNCNELLRNIGANWDTFEAECKILAEYKHKYILVCAQENFEYLFSRGFTKLNPNFIMKQLSYIYMKYHIPTLFFSDRTYAENFAYRTFIEVTKMVRDEQ